MPVSFRALSPLDAAHQLPSLLALDPARIAAELDAEAEALPHATLAELGGALDQLRDAIETVDRFTQKNLHVRLDHALADEPVQPQLRTLLTSTVTSYARDLPLLEQRVMAALTRATPKTAEAATARVVAAARAVLESRTTLHAAIFATTARRATEWLPGVLSAWRDPVLDAATRTEWGKARVDLERLAANGAYLMAGRFAERLVKTEAPPEEPRAEATGDRFALLEID